MYQIRYNTGGFRETESYDEAMLELLTGEVNKVSWTVADGTRLILWWNGTFEVRSPKYWIRDRGINSNVEDVLPGLKQDLGDTVVERLQHEFDGA